MHPGAHLGEGEEAGLKKIVSSIDHVLAEIPEVKTKIALETCRLGQPASGPG
jgi:endonuclease IV